MGVVKKNTLGNFLKKLERVESYDLDSEDIVDKVAEFGVQIAREEYSGTDVQVDAFVDAKSVEIVAQGEGLAYREFGTGHVGEGLYEGNLPQETISFESPEGVPQETQGWKYYYPNELTKHNDGWTYFADGKFHFTKGQEPQAQMYHTSERLKRELGEVVARKIKGA